MFVTISLLFQAVRFMSSNTGTDDLMTIICDCSGTKKGKILQVIDNGATTLDHIARITGACTGCGACDTDVQEILDNKLNGA